MEPTLIGWKLEDTHHSSICNMLKAKGTVLLEIHFTGFRKNHFHLSAECDGNVHHNLYACSRIFLLPLLSQVVNCELSVHLSIHDTPADYILWKTLNRITAELTGNPLESEDEGGEETTEEVLKSVEVTPQVCEANSMFT